MGPKLPGIGRGWSQRPQEHSWTTFGTKPFFKKTPKIKTTSRRPNTVFGENPFFPKHVKSQWDFLTNREFELIYKARKMRNLEVIWYIIIVVFVSFLCAKSSKTNF